MDQVFGFVPVMKWRVYFSFFYMELNLQPDLRGKS